MGIHLDEQSNTTLTKTVAKHLPNVNKQYKSHISQKKSLCASIRKHHSDFSHVLKTEHLISKSVPF
jgi:predicted HD phosphohydrolase